MRTIFVSALAGLFVLGFLGQALAQTPHDKIQRVLLEHHDIEGTDMELRIYRIAYPPGASAPPHHHPVVGLGYVVKGHAHSVFEGEQPKDYSAGDSFEDRAITEHVEFRNASATEPLIFVIAYAIKKGENTLEVP